MKSLSALAAVLILLPAWPAAAQRLPTTVTPDHYALWFAPDLQKKTFRGHDIINVQVKTPTPALTLNAAEIEFGQVTIAAGSRTQTARVTLDAKSETATFTVAQPIPAGAATIDITYTGILNDKLRGFYISKGQNRNYAVSQMEATDARRAFPSFDEPAYKATFDVTLMIDAGDTAISNGPQISDKPGPEPGKHTVTFARSPKMSTYLVALLVGDFVCREGKADDTPVRVCSTPDKKALTAFALEAAEQQVSFYNRFFGIKYPFAKLDIIGIPDFAAGAMENTGAITFRDRLLLVDPQRSSLKTRKDVAAVTAHEIAHQWFGDLVTMRWWDDIWLNEGFATWMANKPLAAWKPEWHVELDDADETQTALSLDVLQTTRAIRTKAETPEEINELFDAIAYEKTAAVLRMIESYVGADQMRAGIRSYLRKYSYANATGEDFWNEVARVTGKPVDRIMKSFVDQPGAPVLTVKAACTAATSDVTITQERFTTTAGAAPASTETWTMPVCFDGTSGAGRAAGGGAAGAGPGSSRASGRATDRASTTNAPRCEVIDRQAQTLKIDGCNAFANAQARGYYLTDYAADAVRAFARSAGTLAPVERLSLLGDEWWMVRSGRHDVDGYLDLAAALANDASPVIVSTIASRVSFTGDHVVDRADQRAFEAWVRTQFGPTLKSLGIPGSTTDDDDRQSRRATLLMLLGVTGNDTEVQQSARELAARYIDDPRSLPPTLAPAVLQVAAVSGDAALYDRYLAQLPKLSATPEDYYRFFNALAWFRDPALVQRTLDFTLTQAARSQDVGILIAGLLGQPTSRDATWTFVKTHWADLTRKLGTFQGIPEIVSGLGSFCSADKAGEMSLFFREHPVPSSSRTIQQAIEKVETCAAMDRRQSAPLAKWLAGK